MTSLTTKELIALRDNHKTLYIGMDGIRKENPLLMALADCEIERRVSEEAKFDAENKSALQQLIQVENERNDFIEQLKVVKKQLEETREREERLKQEVKTIYNQINKSVDLLKQATGDIKVINTPLQLLKFESERAVDIIKSLTTNSSI